MINWLIRVITWLTPPIEGNPNEWLERDYYLRGEKWREFICGSCRGLYRQRGQEFEILAVQNTKKNDNFDRALKWFERSCRRYGFGLAFLSVENPKLENKLRKMGFTGTPEKLAKVFSAD